MFSSAATNDGKNFPLFLDAAAYAYLHNLINQFFSFSPSAPSTLFCWTKHFATGNKNNEITSAATIVPSTQPDKQQPPTIDENCATGSNNSYPQTANGDIPQHAPPLQVSKIFRCFIPNEIIYESGCWVRWVGGLWCDRIAESVNKTKPSVQSFSPPYISLFSRRSKWAYGILPACFLFLGKRRGNVINTKVVRFVLPGRANEWKIAIN